jgi:hypothetical protein
MLEINELHPTHVSDGGNPKTSAWGQGYMNGRFLGVITYLPYNSGYTGRYGIGTSAPLHIAPPLAVINEAYGGTIPLSGPHKLS